MASNSSGPFCSIPTTSRSSLKYPASAPKQSWRLVNPRFFQSLFRSLKHRFQLVKIVFLLSHLTSHYDLLFGHNRLPIVALNIPFRILHNTTIGVRGIRLPLCVDRFVRRFGLAAPVSFSHRPLLCSCRVRILLLLGGSLPARLPTPIVLWLLSSAPTGCRDL